jgi:hypothetical protein
MECLQSFSLTSGGAVTIAPPNFDSWSNGTTNYWQAFSDGSYSEYNFQGFRNINIHSIDVIGLFLNSGNTSNSAIVNDWTWFIQVFGNAPLGTGNITTSPNNFSIANSGINLSFALSKYKTRYDFSTPITSPKQIRINQFVASGYGAESLLSVNLAWSFNFIIYYTFQEN